MAYTVKKMGDRYKKVEDAENEDSKGKTNPKDARMAAMKKMMKKK